MKRTLFDIHNDILALDDLLTEIGGEVTEETAETAIDSWFAELGEERDSKLDGYAYLIRQLESDAETLKAEMDRLKARRTTAENKVKKLKERLEHFLKIQGIDKIQTERFTFALQKPGGKPKVQLSDYFETHPEELPEGLRRVKFEADLEAIREALSNDYENNSIFGQIVESDKKLRIR